MASRDNQTLQSNVQIADIPPLPQEVVDLYGLPMDLSKGYWQFNVAGEDFDFDFPSKNIKNRWLLYALQRHLVSSIRRVSPRECYNIIRLNVLWMEKAASWSKLVEATDLASHELLLNRVMSETLALLRARGVDYNFHRIRAWYSWCVDFIPEFGFDADEAYKWECAQISGNEKGVAVRRSDPTEGPLNDAELILLRRALQRDNSMDPQHVSERSALWLALVYGRNAANFCQLRQHDFHTVEDDEEVWVLDIPRIKKRARPRSLHKTEYVAPPLATVIREQISAAKAIIEAAPRCTQNRPDLPLFPRSEPRSHQLGTAMDEWAWHPSAAEFTQLIRSAVKRYGLVSPRTNEPLHITTRRLRYTFATNRVREGISARDLAEALDHSDLQHVRVYFDARSTVVERLDAAAAKEIAPKLRLFEGELVKNARASNSAAPTHKRIRIIPELIAKDHHVRDLGECGKEEFCNLFPPYSCYPCSRFRPFEDSGDEHEAVFDFLIERRERLRTDPLEQSRIAVQLDEVIYACAQVVLMIRDLESKHAK
jgi:Phage integrase family